MNNESEKTMWRCKPVDNPWTFSSFAKKVICSVLPDPQVSDSENEDNPQTLHGVSENITHAEAEEENPYSSLLSLPNVRTLFWHEDPRAK
ncbi:hypothetical protein [Escherichia coli]|uniref:hypothetical protein n=1 Tax=Escherichia coli TaxID=562 RepID=UPI001768F06A|nr:hypothetical protein [Escherichia coli]HAH9782237.1 hypothetical protein [Escherichia coli]HAU9488954.1 hypothetical protein [Escherichia coli]